MHTESKDILRKRNKEIRDSVPISELKSSSDMIFRRVEDEGLLKNVDCILCYINFRSEVITTDFVSYLLKNTSIKVFVPKTEGDEMNFYRIESLDDLDRGYMGILEPVDCSKDRLFVRDINLSTLCITPGLAFDVDGNRMGYGGGFYDRFFDRNPEVLRLGVCLDVLISDNVPRDANDIKMNYIVSEKRFITIDY